MKRFMLSAAILLLCTPAFGQERHNPGERRGEGRPPSQYQQRQGRPPQNAMPQNAMPQNRPPPQNAPPQNAPPQNAPPQNAMPQNRPYENRPSQNRPPQNRPAENRPQPGPGRPGGPGNEYRPGNNYRPGGPGPGFEQRPGNRPHYNPGRPNPNWNNWRRDYGNWRPPHRYRYQGPSYYRPQGWYYRRWTFGDFLPSLFWSSQYWISNWGLYDLPPPPPGAVWVRYGNDAVLIDRFTGEVIAVQYDFFY